MPSSFKDKGGNEMTFGTFRLKPAPDHLAAVISVLEISELISPQGIAKQSGLSLTKVRCALAQLEKEEKLIIVQQEMSPKLRVKLKK